MPEASEYHVPRTLLQKYAKPGPRYTSYPTAPVWDNHFTPQAAQEIYAHNNTPDNIQPIALYIHIPFCTQLCWYCGCNVKIARNKSVATPYLKALDTELTLLSRQINPRRKISQMHWGGGTPTYLSPEQIVALVNQVRHHLDFTPTAERSIEVDPRVTTAEHLQALRDCGFNRISMGVQDFNPKVQSAVNREQSFELTAELIATSRRLGFVSINIDLMYGLPFQTVDSFSETLQQIQSLNPDRLALFHYAHVPWLKPAQKLIKPEMLPGSDTKLDIFELAIDHLLGQGYRYIGMDHFARPEDELSQAQDQRSLRRNFMGYTTQAGVDLYGLGVSSISEIDGHFIQNEREVPAYQKRLEHHELPLLRGMKLSKDDQIRKKIIEQLICNGYLDYASLESTYAIDFQTTFRQELVAAETLAADALLEMSPVGMRVLPRGQILIRNICMLWDAYLTQQQGKQMFSQTA